jgi:hypothetical protein
VSVKDRWVGPREQVLNVTSKPSSRPLIDAWLCHHYFIGWLRREAGYGPIDRSVARCGLCREPFFLRAVGLLNSVDDSKKVATYGDCPQDAYTGRTWTGMGSIHGVLVGVSTAGCKSP